MFRPATEFGQDNPDGPPAFRTVWHGYDPEEVDAYLPQLSARMREAVDRSAQAEQAKAELQRELTSLREESLQQLGGEAAALLQEAGRSAEQLVEHARAGPRPSLSRPNSRPSRFGRRPPMRRRRP